MSPMESSYPIHDLFVRKLEYMEEGRRLRLPILRYDDHLLRRFGIVEMVQLKPVQPEEMRMRAVADELWALLEGKALFIWRDLRSTSPTFGVECRLTAEESLLVLVPFGVAFAVQALEKPARLLRLSTHADGMHEGDRSVSWEVG
jgi:hypothetical protein